MNYYEKLEELAAGVAVARPTFLEIGTYKAKSAIALARGHEGALVLTIDIILRSDVTQLLCYADRIFPIQGHSNNVSRWIAPALFRSVDLLFVDGDHVAPQPLRDVQNYLICLKDSAILAMHDTHMPGVAVAWDYISQYLSNTGECETMKYGWAIDAPK